MRQLVILDKIDEHRTNTKYDHILSFSGPFYTQMKMIMANEDKW